MLNKSDITLVRVDWATIKYHDLILIVLPWGDQGVGWDFTGKRLWRQDPKRGMERWAFPQADIGHPCFAVWRSQTLTGVKEMDVGSPAHVECPLNTLPCFIFSIPSLVQCNEQINVGLSLQVIINVISNIPVPADENTSVWLAISIYFLYLLFLFFSIL